MQKVLICGGTGFIGRNLVEALSQRADIELHATRYVRPTFEANVTWHRADLRDPLDVDRVMAHRFDIVIQAAATTSGARDIVGRPHHHVTDNAVMNSLMLRSYHEAGGGHFLFFSCSIMYPSRERPWSEHEWSPALENQITPAYFGAAHTKLYIERMCEFYANLGHMRCTVMRNSNIYGPWDKFGPDGHVMGSLIGKALTEERLEVWGDGREARDWLHVDDLTALVIRLLDRSGAPYRMLHASSGSARPIGRVAYDLALQRGLKVVFQSDRPTLPVSIALNPARARETGWQPRIGLTEGMARTMAWKNEHRASS